MPNTSRMKWPVPTKDADPWYDPFTDMLAAMDASSYAAREDRNIICMGGGSFTWNATTGQLTWSANIELLAANTGFLWTIGTGNVTLADGQLCYLTLVRFPTSSVALGLNVASNLSAATDGDASFVLCVRRGSRLFFRNGRVIADGETFAVFETNGPSGGGGGLTRYALPERWTQSDVAASQTSIALSGSVSTNFDEVRAVRAGSIVGLAAQLTEAVSAGTLTIRVTINGTPGTLNAVLSSGLGGQATQGSGVDTYAAGALIGIKITTSGTFAPVTTDLEAWLEVQDS